MNQNAEIFAKLLAAPLDAILSIRWWHVALAVGLSLTVLGFAIYGILHLVGVA